jgi:hypothetical protein
MIDFGRTNGYWEENTIQAIQTVASWVIDMTVYSVMETDLSRYPTRDDFPGWNHVGHHEELGHLYWNFFFASFSRRSPTLQFGDAPDFHGSYLENEQRRREIYGDIGQISVSAFAQEVLPQLRKHDLWVSVLDEHRQAIIEPLVDSQALIHHHLAEAWGW